MSHYTTGEIAKLCGVTVRTVQYYDTRLLLIPSELTEGGRRLYTEEDVKRLRTICFLREAGLSINTISSLLQEEDPGSVIGILIDRQKVQLQHEISEKEGQLARIDALEQAVKATVNFSVETIGDMVHVMADKKKMNRFYMKMVVLALPLELAEIAALIAAIKTGHWWIFAIWFALMIPITALFVRYYYRRVKYICAQCHETFRPSYKEFFFANHTLRTRKLTCTCCGHKGFAVETLSGE